MSITDQVMDPAAQDAPFRLRSYQAEMVEESLETNVIVAMDTGSGKTHIALSRTAAELETCRPEQLVWFLAPTVTLCEQQSKVFQLHLPAYNLVYLSGDEVERWSDQTTWDSVLNNARVVVSTHQVLLDALTHAFVRLSKLALLIFDEAHHCVGKHPSNQIMANFYHPARQAAVRNRQVIRDHLPRILGLSASPVMKARATGNDLHEIECNLDSIAKSPKVHRSELLRFVHRPELREVTYAAGPVEPDWPPSFAALQLIYQEYDLKNDPYVLSLLERHRQGLDCTRTLEKVLSNRKTYCLEQLKRIVVKGNAMTQELGRSPTEWYLQQCIRTFQKIKQSLEPLALDWSLQERQHLSKIFQSLPGLDKEAQHKISLEALSSKVERLIDVLVSEASPGFTGLVFVEQRAWVAALSEILAIHPRTKDLFTVGTFVGTSNSAKRKPNIADLAEPRNQQDTLDDFRAGRINLILATSVLEEGIDVSSCHLVICFERPKNLKSFIQRRGRARMPKSKYIIFLPASDSNTHSPGVWESLEEQMKQEYLNDLREIEKARQRELEDEEGVLYYRVETTGALLTSDNATPHLNHFCSTLGLGPYVDPRPQFTFHETREGTVTAEVLLPLSVDPSLRRARSEKAWRTERMARNDAAFQAYKALHQSGLVNDNMLPYRTEDDAETATFQIPDHTPALVQVSPPFIPWISVANQQRQSPLIYYRTLLKASAPELGLSSMVLFTPCPTPEVPGFLLHWSEAKRFSVQSSPLSKTVLTEEELSTMRRITRKVLSSVLNGKWTQESREDFLWLIAPYDVDTAGHIVNSRLAHFDTLTNGQTSASYLLQQTGCATAQWGLVSLSGDAKKYILQTIRDGAALPIGPSEALMEVVRTPKRRDFLHRIPAGTKKNEAYTKVELLSPTDCVVDNLPAAYSIFALLVPSIIYKLEMFMSADVLRTTILKPVSFEPDHTALLVQAITSSATGEEDNYQRLEFLGDCILKYIASVHLMAAHLLKTESFLTGRKGKVVSNGFLARATMEAGLDRFIITKRFTGKSWTPHFASDILKGQDEAGNETEERTTPVVLRSSKLLADVIESLIGASYIIGGFDKAFTCIQTLLPLEDWTPISKATTLLFSSAPTDFSPSNLSTLEQLIGHTFTKKLLLLEALTHASYTGVHAHVRSYERLEFLGDAVLDYIISTLLFRHSPELPHQQMHGIRTAMANAAFLAFRMFETTISEERINTATLEPERVSRQIWQFLRHASSPDMISARETALRQHAASRTAILHSLTHDSRYPWHLFASNDAPKFFSDIVESIIGAVYVDTQGDISACKEVVRRLGILDCLERILRDRVDCLHPKERLGILAVDKGVEYVRVGEEGRKEGERENGEAEEAGKKGVWKCQVRVGGVDIGGPVEGLKRLNAETIAAWRAVQILEAKKEEDVVMRDVNEMLMEEADSGDDEGEDWHDAEEGGVMLDVTL